MWLISIFAAGHTELDARLPKVVGLGGTVLTHRCFDAQATLGRCYERGSNYALARILGLPRPVGARNPVPIVGVVQR